MSDSKEGFTDEERFVEWPIQEAIKLSANDRQLEALVYLLAQGLRQTAKIARQLERLADCNERAADDNALAVQILAREEARQAAKRTEEQ